MIAHARLCRRWIIPTLENVTAKGLGGTKGSPSAGPSVENGGRCAPASQLRATASTKDMLGHIAQITAGSASLVGYEHWIVVC